MYKAVGIQKKFLIRGCMAETKKRKDCVNEETTASVTEFFLDGNVTTNVPNIKCVKDPKEKHVLNTSLKSAFYTWKAHNPDKDLSYDRFCKLKPKHVLNQKHRKLFQCLCEYSENVNLKFTSHQQTCRYLEQKRTENASQVSGCGSNSMQQSRWDQIVLIESVIIAVHRD